MTQSEPNLASRVYDDIVGTQQLSMMLDEYIEETFGVKDVALEVLQEIDSLLFACEMCGYWTDLGEMHSDHEYACTECGNSM